MNLADHFSTLPTHSQRCANLMIGSLTRLATPTTTTHLPCHPSINKFIRIQPLANRGIHTCYILPTQTISRFPCNALLECFFCQGVYDGLDHHLLLQRQRKLLHVTQTSTTTAKRAKVGIGGGERCEIVASEIFRSLGIIVRVI